MLFKVGAKYKFRTLEGGDEITSWGTIETYEHPLIKLEDTVINLRLRGGGEGEPKSYPGAIINVISPNFISAVEETD